jgi:alkanesulfonate monooxygenase SsuD/methylene tetrahydromethanopterin reductase-like flavin-dependent oxidoreductase (luciferase family)
MKFTVVTTLSLLDPVCAFEDYSTLDNLSGGRLELIIGPHNEGVLAS